MDRKKQKKDNWTIKITVITFFTSLTLGFFSDVLSKSLNIFIALLILIFIILVGIISDIIGISIASANEKPFHSMSSNKIKGASEAIFLLKNADRATNLFNDVIGDIAGIISGAMGATIGTYFIIYMKSDLMDMIFLSVVSAIIAAFTVGGKSLGKKTAIKNADKVVFIVGKAMAFFKRRNK